MRRRNSVDFGGRKGVCGRFERGANGIARVIRKRERKDVIAVRSVADGCDEAIAAARNGLEVAGIFRVVCQHFADLLYAEINAPLEVHKGVVAPEAASNLLPGHDLSGPFRKQEEDTERLWMDLQREPGFAQFPGRGDQIEFAETYHQGRMSR